MASSFELDLTRALETAADEGMKQRGQELQRLLDCVHSTDAGKPVELVIAHLRSEWKRRGWGTVRDEQLTAYAQALSAGNRVVVKVEPVRL